MLYALLLFIYSFMLLAVEMLKVYNNMAPYLIPMPKFLKMRPSYDTRGSSSRNQFPFPKPIGSNVLAIGMHLFGMSYRGFA